MRKISLSILIALILSHCAAQMARAQDRPERDQDAPVKLKADFVSITASVVDQNGRAIKTLKAGDFMIYEDGVRQEISNFSTTEGPFTLMLLLDISGSTLNDIELMKRAARGFLSELRKDDRVGVIVFSRDVEMIAEISDTRARVEAAIDEIASTSGIEGSRYTEKTGTSFYDALYLAVEESPLKQAEGRKAIVCMSDGVDSTSKMAYSEVARLVEKSEASVYFLELNTEEAMLAGLIKPRGDPGYINFSKSQIDRYYDKYDRDSVERHRPRDLITPLIRREIAAGLYEIARGELRELSTRTGGRAYAVRSLFDLAGVYKQVADDLRSQYLLSYYSSNEATDGRWRSIRVEVRQRATVRARSGYWGPKK
jgi:Ca-activated chloride channel family protein